MTCGAQWPQRPTGKEDGGEGEPRMRTFVWDPRSTALAGHPAAADS